MTIRDLFATQLYHGALAEPALIAALAASCRALARGDGAGRAWSKANGYAGYTSYASLNDLPKRDPAFAALKKALDVHAAAFAKALCFDLGGRKLKLDSMWANVLAPGGAHSGHIHPHSVLSGTVYVDTPAGASALKLEDPRLPLMMAAPLRRADAPEAARQFVYVTPNGAARARISVSFNYGW